jgi:hypothetical protein
MLLIVWIEVCKIVFFKKYHDRKNTGNRGSADINEFVRPIGQA